VSLRSIQDVEKYRRVLEEAGSIDYVAQVASDLARALEDYWNRFAIPLGRLEGMVESYLRSKEFRVISEIVGDFFENDLKRFLELREEYSRASHEFMHEVVYGGGYGLYFIAAVTGVKLGRLQDIARKKKSAVTTVELFEEILKVINKFFDDHAKYLGTILGKIATINDVLREEGLEPVWDEAKLDAITRELVNIGVDMWSALFEAVDGSVIAISNRLEYAYLYPEIEEHYEFLTEIVERISGKL
jgi:hypothetical protein